MNRKVHILILLSVFVLCACNYRGSYKEIRAGERAACQHGNLAEYDECMERANENYDIYKRKRDETLEQG